MYVFFKGCCNYGTVIASSGAAIKTIAFDCLNIPGAKSVLGAINLPNNFCGGRLASINANAIQKTICCKSELKIFLKVGPRLCHAFFPNF
jgi:hypothetical protein